MFIELKKWTLGDREKFADICNHTNQTYLSFDMPYPMRTADARWWLEYVVQNDGITGLYRAIYYEQECIGQIYLRIMNDNYALLTYFLKEKYENRGIMTYATSLICQEAFDSFSIDKIQAHVCEGNIASQRVLEKNTFSLKEVKKKTIVNRNQVLCDQYIYEKK